MSSYNTPVHTEQGGKKLVVGSGGELELQAGSTLDLQDGIMQTVGNGSEVTVESGGKVTVESGGELELQSGAIFDPQSGVIGPVVWRELVFTETGAGTYTGTVAIPAGATILDIQVRAIALWDAATSAELNVGDDDAAAGFWATVNLKATDLLAGEILSFAQPQDQAGSYLTGGVKQDTYRAVAKTISAVIVSDGAGTAGRTRILVAYILPNSSNAVKT